MLLVRPKPAAKPQAAGLIPLEIGGLRVRPSTRARRMGLRVDARLGEVVFTWPVKSRITAEKALRFIEQNRGWIEKHRKAAAPAQVFAAGLQLAIAGRNVTITPVAGRGVTRLEGDALLVHGAPEHLARRVKDFLKTEAARYLQRLTDDKSAALGLKPVAIRIADPRSRWGSCTPDGRIMYSWRLILAPPGVMDYVAAHEVAHRIHLNHGRKFWALCDDLAADMSGSRHWLKTEGRQLMGFGA